MFPLKLPPDKSAFKLSADWVAVEIGFCASLVLSTFANPTWDFDKFTNDNTPELSLDNTCPEIPVTYLILFAVVNSILAFV